MLLLLSALDLRLASTCDTMHKHLPLLQGR